MENIIRYNEEIFRLLKDRENLFKDYAALCHMNPTEHWVLYTVYSGQERNLFYNQRDLSTLWAFPKQTIHTAVKNLCKDRLVVLQEGENNKKEKLIVLTDRGFALAEKIIRPLIQVELESFLAFTQEERATFLHLLSKWIKNVEHGVHEISEDL